MDIRIFFSLVSFLQNKDEFLTKRNSLINIVLGKLTVRLINLDLISFRYLSTQGHVEISVETRTNIDTYVRPYENYQIHALQ